MLFNITNGTLRPPTEAAFQSSKTNFGPRLSMTWSPNPNSDWILRRWPHGAARRFRNLLWSRSDRGSDSTDRERSHQLDVHERIRSIPRQPLAFPLDSNAAIAFFNNPANVNTRSYQPRAYSPDYEIPEKVYQYTFSLQQELFSGTVLTAAYVGSQGRNLFLRSIANKILPGQTTVAKQRRCTSCRSWCREPAGSDTGRITAVRTVREFSIISGNNVQNPFAEVDYKTSGGDDSYNALQMTLARRITTGLTLNSQYTFSRSFGNTAGSNEARTSAIPDNFEADRGYNNFDVRHTFNFSALYKLPFGKGTSHDFGTVGNALLGDWEIGGIVNARSGLPIEVGIIRPDVVMQCAAGDLSGDHQRRSDDGAAGICGPT